MLKNIIIISGLILIIAVGYYLFIIQDQGLQSGNSVVSSQAQQETEMFLNRLNQIQSIELSTGILQDPRFTNRKDHSTEIPLLPTGRENPFLPAN